MPQGIAENARHKALRNSVQRAISHPVEIQEPDLRPFPESYWVVPGRFLAAEYPRSLDDEASRRKLSAILASGLNTFIDLTTHHDPLKPYEYLFDGLPPEISNGAHRENFPILDMNPPDSREHVIAILDAIDGELAMGNGVYLHCWGGIGRTGTIAGCWLVRHGRSGEEALEHLNTLWRVNPKRVYWPYIPQTSEQIEFVKNWSEIENVV